MTDWLWNPVLWLAIFGAVAVLLPLGILAWIMVIEELQK